MCIQKVVKPILASLLLKHMCNLQNTVILKFLHTQRHSLHKITFTDNIKDSTGGGKKKKKAIYDLSHTTYWKSVTSKCYFGHLIQFGISRKTNIFIIFMVWPNHLQIQIKIKNTFYLLKSKMNEMEHLIFFFIFSFL